MTINIADNNPRVSYSVSAGVTQTSFAVPFEFFDETDVLVYIDSTLKTITTDYTVSGGDGTTGTITMSVTGPATVALVRDVTIERSTDFPTAGPFSVQSLNVELDKQIAIDADISDQIDRAVRSPIEEFTTMTLPNAATRADKILKFDTDGNVAVESASALTAGAVVGANFTNNTFTGDGSQTAFTTTVEAGSKNNAQVYIDGVYQLKSSFSVSGLTLTFTEAPPLNSQIEVIIGNAIDTVDADSGNVNYNLGSASAQTRTVENRLQDVVSINDFTGVDIGAKINAALADGHLSIFIPSGNYVQTTAVVMTAGSRIWSYGAIVTKGANIDMFTMHSNTSLLGFGINGAGATYTGRGIVIGSQNDQTIQLFYVTDMNGYCVEYTANDGGLRSTIWNGTYLRTTATNPAIKLPTLDSPTAGGRHFAEIFGAGGHTFDLAGSTMTKIDKCNIAGITFGTDTRFATITESRLACTVDLYGTGNTIENCTIADDVEIFGTKNQVVDSEIADAATAAVNAAASSGKYINLRGSTSGENFSRGDGPQKIYNTTTSETALELDGPSSYSGLDLKTNGTLIGRIFCDASMYVRSTGNVKIDSGASFTPIVEATVGVAPAGSFRPQVDDVIDLGDASHRYNDIYATNATIQTSDVNLKTNIADAQLGLEFINSLRPVDYKWKDTEVSWSELELDDDGIPTGETIEHTKTIEHSRLHSGLIAQELAQVLEDAGLDRAMLCVDDDGKHGVRYSELIAPLIKAIQELSAKVDSLS